jgi:hypothetical protein
VDDASCNCHCGVVVPKPVKLPLVIRAASVPPLLPIWKMIASLVPTPDVDLRDNVDPAAEPPMTIGDVREVATPTVPVKLAVLEIVWELMRAEVMAPKIELPAFKAVANKLVDDAVVEKRLVVVALVEVEFKAVKFWRVEDAVARRLARVTNPVPLMVNLSVVPRTVEEAIANLPLETS